MATVSTAMSYPCGSKRKACPSTCGHIREREREREGGREEAAWPAAAVELRNRERRGEEKERTKRTKGGSKCTLSITS